MRRLSATWNSGSRRNHEQIDRQDARRGAIAADDTQAQSARDNSTRAASAKRLMIRKGRSAGINVSGSMNASMLACFLVRPRTATTSAVAAITVPVYLAPL